MKKSGGREFEAAAKSAGTLGGIKPPVENLVRPAFKMAKFDITKHILMPKHSKLSEREKKELLDKYSITLKEIPRIFKDDEAIENLDAKEGDIIKIIRKSLTAGETIFYRRVVNV